MRRAVPLLVLLLVISLLPAVAVAVTEVSDTLYVIKQDQQPSNAAVAVTLSQATPLSPTRVLVGRDDVFVDSMTSGVLQGASPLLLVPPAGPVPAEVLAELARLGPQRVTLLGGEQALTPAVAQELSGRGYTVDRRSGASRFETAIAIAENGPSTTTAILARAFAAEGAGDPTQAFADSLAAGGMAAENGWPILLTGTDELAGPTADYLAAQAFDRVLIMGGTAAVSAAVEAEVRDLADHVDRISGPNRFATGVEVAKELGAQSAADVAQVTLVDAQGPDAWAGGFAAAAHSALFDAPIVLGTNDTLPEPTQTWLAGGSFAGPQSFALTCVIDAAICEDGRVALALPPAVVVGFTPPDGGTIQPGGRIVVDVGTRPAEVAGGSCVDGQSGPLPDDGAVTVTAQPGGATCDLIITLTLAPGLTQTETATFAFGVVSAIAPLSVDVDGNAIGGRFPDIADSGGAVVYLSDGDPTGLVGDRAFHVYLAGGDQQLVDVRPDGQPADGMLIASIVTRPRVSGDGQRVLFHSGDPGLATAGPAGSGTTFLYLRDQQDQTTTLVSTDAQGAPVTNLSFSALSDDGDVVAFVGSGAGPDAGGSIQVFIRNVSTGALDVVRAADGSTFLNAAVSALDLSLDGQTVVFNSEQPDLVDGDANARDDTFAYHVGTRTIELLSVNDQGEPTMGDANGIDQQVGVSGDGMQVVFANGATNLAGAPGTAGGGDVFLRNRGTASTLLISRTDGGGTPMDDASQPAISGDGRQVTFRSSVAPSGAPGGAGCGIYVSAGAGPPRRVDVAGDGTTNSNGCSSVEFATVSTPGLVAFSVFDDLTPQDNNGVPDVYIYVGGVSGTP